MNISHSVQSHAAQERRESLKANAAPTNTTGAQFVTGFVALSTVSESGWHSFRNIGDKMSAAH